MAKLRDADAMLNADKDLAAVLLALEANDQRLNGGVGGRFRRAAVDVG